QGDPLKVGACICTRPDCVAGMYKKFKRRREKEQNGSGDKWWLGSRHRWADALPRAF
ncbi:unnamed protein product, partial [Ectocarpus sp. 13 AM-2016]